MIQFRNLALARGARRLIDNLSLQIHPGWRIGVVGANGTGKSSLFALLRGELQQEQGDLDIPSAWTIAHVAQETPALTCSALDYILEGDAELRRVQRDLVAAEVAHDGHLIGELHTRLQEIEGYSANARASTLLHGLGFSDADFSRPVSDFSGGWRMRLNLGQALMCRSDLLLLDEPTNHLDLDAVVWLEKWLAAYRGTLLLISHDRDFLDACVTHIAFLDAQKLTLYTGDYDAFEDQHAAQLAQQQALFEKQQREVAHLQKYIDRFRAQATKARQAQSRIKALARMERITAAHVDTPFDFAFPEPDRAPDPMVTLKDVQLGYGDKTIIAKLKLELRPGARLGLLGPNGAGKSTLIKLLAGDLAAQSGTVLLGKGVVLGYFAQHQLEQLRPDESPLQHLIRQEPMTREQELRDYLGGFDFRGPMADAKVGPFSGGEKSRLALALLIRHKPNLLLLDEPTNHLDLEMRHALTLALSEYEGSMVLVSHDRALLRTVCDDFLLVADGLAQPFDGDIEDYLVWLDARRSREAAARVDVQAADDKASRIASREAEKADRQARIQRRRPLLKELEQLERKLQGWQGEKKLLDERVSDPALYASGDGALVQSLLKRQGELGASIDAGEERWLEIQTELEEIGEV
ncbi:ATP-binding cassette domain-containing protein [Uliginosibacterium aquaticum]|uniref:ATP-binding cassette domain-containing protein n=1 Tax=Uliginosibacterium aquaticum TaxID=2731212 RepID=A0ABX2IKC8_9RHOO|nr:ATP-binding cassette domain-containing protein [Uliginosibacterium aquaticum]NSL56942.1 ATP-binding cassette domain-containing protein [Uliginosibacterium aquaticum]